MVVSAVERHEVTYYGAVARKHLADALYRVPFLAHLPVVLTVEDVALGERNFKSKFDLRQERNF